MTIGKYLIDKLYNLGVRHVFGIPGDFVLGFYKLLEDSGIKLVVTCDEQGAGHAADAYARVTGLGVVCVTYCVGGLKVANATAQAYAEKSPVIVISGAPGIGERFKNPLLHHKVRDFDTQKKVFDELTVASTVIDDPQGAYDEIDRVIDAAMQYKRPVYIELPRDMVHSEGRSCGAASKRVRLVDDDVLKEALNEATEMINSAKRPVIMADVEVHRFGLQDTLLKLAEKTNIPVCSTILGKSVFPEIHPLYIGVYEGALGREDVVDYVEGSDCLIMLGVFLSDVNLGIYTAKLDQKVTIYSTSEKLSIKYHQFEHVDLVTFMDALMKAPIKKHGAVELPHPSYCDVYVPVPEAKMTAKRLFERLNTIIKDNTVVVSDVGDSLLGALDLCIHSKTEFLSPAYYTSMGFAVPGALGVQLARPEVRPLVIVGDGAFQMTGLELSTIAKHGLNPIVVLLNNRGYGTERPMLDGAYNVIHSWNYSRIPDIVGAGHGFVVETEGDLERALSDAQTLTDSFSLIEVRLDMYDFSPGLRRFSAHLSRRVKNT